MTGALTNYSLANSLDGIVRGLAAAACAGAETGAAFCAPSGDAMIALNAPQITSFFMPAPANATKRYAMA